DVDREIVVERPEALERLRAQGRLRAARLDDGADQGAELVAPREAVVAETDVATPGQHGDRRKALEAAARGAGGRPARARLVLDAAGDAIRERRELRDDALGLGREVDLAGPEDRRLLRPVRDDQLDGALERVEEPAHPRLVLGTEDGHPCRL